VEEEVTTIEVIVNPREALSRRERREYRGIETIGEDAYHHAYMHVSVQALA